MTFQSKYRNISLPMGREDIIAKIKDQNFPNGSYVVFGSGPLAAAGIRTTRDIDLVVSPGLYSVLQQQGWRFKADPSGNPMLTKGVFEVSKCWSFGEYDPSFNDLLNNADFIDGIPFVNLREVRKWKQALARAKDIDDIDDIDRYMQGSLA